METLREAHEWTEGMWKPQPPPKPTKIMRSASLPQLPSPELKAIGGETFISTGIMGEESPCLPASEAGISDTPSMTPSSPAMTPSRPLRDRSEVGLYALCATERLATPHIQTWNTCTTDSRASFTLHLVSHSSAEYEKGFHHPARRPTQPPPQSRVAIGPQQRCRR